MLPPYTQLVAACLAMLASGMSPSDVAAIAEVSSRGHSWPKQATAWKSCLADLANNIGNWEVIWAMLYPLASTRSGLTWAQVFRAVGRTFKVPKDRFAFIYELLRVHRRPGGGAILEAWLPNLHHAGIDPISLQFCCDPTLWEPKLSRMIRRRIGEAKARPVCYDNALHHYDIYEWAVDVPHHVALDGVVTNLPLRVSPYFVPSKTEPVVNRLGNRMLFGGDVVVNGGENIQTLGNDIHVFGNLELQGLRNLVRLGHGITIEGNLTITGSPHLKGLPSDLRVGDMVRVINPSHGFRWGSPDLKKKGTSRINLFEQEIIAPSSLLDLRGAI